MAIDILLKLDEIELVADGDNSETGGAVQRVVCSSPDLELRGGKVRAGPGTNPHRRALVHAHNNLLAVNFAGDYGGVHIQGPLALLPPAVHLIASADSPFALLSYEGEPGAVENVESIDLLSEINNARWQIQVLRAEVAELRKDLVELKHFVKLPEWQVTAKSKAQGGAGIHLGPPNKQGLGGPNDKGW